MPETRGGGFAAQALALLVELGGLVVAAAVLQELHKRVERFELTRAVLRRPDDLTGLAQQRLGLVVQALRRAHQPQSLGGR